MVKAAGFFFIHSCAHNEIRKDTYDNGLNHVTLSQAQIDFLKSIDNLRQLARQENATTEDAAMALGHFCSDAISKLSYILSAFGKNLHALPEIKHEFAKVLAITEISLKNYELILHNTGPVETSQDKIVTLSTFFNSKVNKNSAAPTPEQITAPDLLNYMRTEFLPAFKAYTLKEFGVSEERPNGFYPETLESEISRLQALMTTDPMHKDLEGIDFLSPINEDTWKALSKSLNDLKNDL